MQSDRVILDIGSVGDFGYSRFCVPAQERDFFVIQLSPALLSSFASVAFSAARSAHRLRRPCPHRENGAPPRRSAAAESPAAAVHLNIVCFFERNS